MPAFVIDPLLVTTPPPEAPREEVARFLTCLEQWLQELETSPFLWCHFLECSYRLQELERFPTFKGLRDQARRHGLDHNVRYLMNRLDAFFQDPSRDVRGHTATRFTLLEESEPIVTPGLFLDRQLPALRESLGSALLCLACDRAAGEAFAAELGLVTLPFGDDRLERERPELGVAGTVGLVEPESLGARLPTTHLQAKLPLIFSPGELTFSVDEVLALGFPIFAQAVTRQARRLFPTCDPLPCLAGGEFWASLEASTIDTSQTAMEKLLRLCASIAARQVNDNDLELRPLRASIGAEAAQRVRRRDGARAWRLTVTKKGVGWHLHYWHIPARLPDQPEALELALVVRRSDPQRIPE